MKEMSKKHGQERSIKDTPLVSIVTPTYNAEKFIEDMLISVKCQTYPNIEHVVIDDGSTDKTVGILRKYEHAYNLRRFSKLHEGQAATLNKGVDLARGELVAFLYADDVLFDTRVIGNLVQYFKKNREIDVVYGHIADIDEKNRLLKIQRAIPWFSYERLLQAHYAFFICYRRKILSKYKFDTSLNFVTDYEQGLRMAKDGIKFGCLNKILLAHRRHKVSTSVCRRKDQKAEAIKVQKLYGRRFSIRCLLMNFSDRLFLLCFKICGVVTVAKLYFHPKNFHLAFPIRFGSFLRTIMGQLIPYIWINMGKEISN